MSNTDNIPEFGNIIEFIQSNYFTMFLNGIDKQDKITLLKILRDLKFNHDIDKKLIDATVMVISHSKYSSVVNYTIKQSLSHIIKGYVNKIIANKVNLKELPAIKKVGIDNINKFLDMNIFKGNNQIDIIKGLLK